MVQGITFSLFPHLLDRKDSTAPTAPAAGAGHYFLPFPIQPHPLIPLILVRTKMPSLEIFQSNKAKKPTKRNVDCNAVYGFRSAAKPGLTLAVFDIINLCSAVFT